MKKVSGRLANLTPEQREKLLKKLREQKKEQESGTSAEKVLPLEQFRADENTPVLSFAQQRLWFLDQLESQKATYNIPAALHFTGDLNIAALQQSFQYLIKRHQSLRTNFINEEGRAKPYVRESISFELNCKDLSSFDKKSKEEEIKALSSIESLKPFSLAEDSLIRARLLIVSPREHVLLITMHHIISDGWSMSVLVKEISQAYQAFCHHKKPKLETLSLQYSDFAAWQRQYLKSSVFIKQVSFWKKQLEGLEVLNLPCDFPRPAVQSTNGRQKVFEINENITERLKKLAKAENKTLFTVLLSAWKVLLYGYSGQTDICVGTPVANRSHQLLESIIGIFVNSLAIRTDVNPENSFYELMEKVQTNSLSAYANQDIPFEQLIDELGLARDMSQSPIFQNMFSFHSESLENELAFPGLQVSLEPLHTLTAKFDISLDVVDEQRKLKASIEFNTDLFETATIEQVTKHFVSLLEVLVEHPGKSFSTITFLSEAEQAQILLRSSGKRIAYPAYKNVVELLLASVPRRATALRFEGKSLSYAELHERSEFLALYLQNRGLKAQAPVALCFERSFEMVIAMLAVLKAGSPYLPLDPELPQDRLDFMVEDSGVQFILCSEPFEKKFVNSINLNDQETLNAIARSDGKLANVAQGKDLFNIIYTSGSTGKPKGVMVSHAGILNRIQWMQSEYQLKPEDKVLQKTTYSFDVSVWEFIWPLSSGACLVLAAPEGHKDPVYLSDLIQKENISHCHFVPSMLQSWLVSGEAERAGSLQKVFCSGEALSRETVNQFYQALPQSELHNLYGPTEASIDVSYWHCEQGEANECSVPIGLPVANTELFVLDKQGHLLAPGVTGELHIGGIQVARGYLNRAELNAQTFIEYELCGQLRRLYKTGDLVRQRRDGVIEYLGRIDHQIKIRGYRIELGEIESALLGQAQISHCVVVASQALGTQQLVAYVSTSEIKDDVQKSALRTQLKNHLNSVLPNYMVPTVIMVLDEIPLLSNGKINRKALPAAVYEQAMYQAPRNPIEKTLTSIWQEILRIEQVGISDNFFELGGDSILSIQIISAARKRNIVISPKQLFRYPTIAELAQIASTDSGAVNAEQGHVRGEFTLNSAQRWFFETHAKSLQESEQAHLDHFNQSILLNLKKNVDTEILTQVISELITQHDALNLRFQNKNTYWLQAHRSELISNEFASSLVSEVSLFESGKASEKSLHAILEDAQKKLSIETGRLLHCKLIRYQSNNRQIKEHQRLYIVIHHLVIDGISWRILLADINRILQSYFSEQPKEKIFPDKTLSFKQWTRSLQEQINSDLFSKDRAYLFNILEKIETYKDPVFNNKQLKEFSYADVKRAGFSLDVLNTDKFLKQANRSFRTTANDILLCALLDAFNETEKPQQLLLTLETHGRELNDDLFEKMAMPDVSRTVGWFTSLYPVLLESKNVETDNWGTKLKQIKEQLRAIPNKGLGFGLLAYADQSKQVARLYQQHRPKISFNYLGQFDSDIESDYFSLDTNLRHIERFGVLDQAKELPRNAPLDIVLFVSDGCLQCDFLYDGKIFSEAQIRDYLQKYQQKIATLINYCCQQKRQQLSPSDLPAASLNQTEIELLESEIDNLNQENKNLEALEIETIHRLLPTQEGMLFHSIFDAQQDNYFEQFCVKLNGQLDASLLEQSWRAVISKYANLRSFFHWQFKEALQIVVKTYPFSIQVHDFLSSDFTQQDFKNFLENDRQKGFDLSFIPLMRFSLLNLKNNQQWFVWSFHHILLDGWSVPLVLNDLFKHYLLLTEENSGSRISSLNENIFRFEDYVSWFYKHKDKDTNFWKAELAGFGDANVIDLEPLALPIQPQETEGADAHVSLKLDVGSSEALRRFSRSKQVTLNTLLQGAWALLLHHYCGDDDIVFGSTVSGRSEAFRGSESIVGLFINTLPLRVSFSENSQLLPWLKKIQEKQQAINEHQTTSLVDIQKLSGMDADNSLFNSILVFENFPVNERLKQDNSYFSVEEFYSFEKTNYPLTISVEPGQQIVIRVLYDKSIYRKNSMERLLGHIRQILHEFISENADEKNILDMDYMSDEERNALNQWNETQTTYPRNASLIDLVEQKVLQNPKQIAIKFDQQTLTYEALNQLANQRAHFLMQQGVSKGDRIVLFMDRSIELLISALAVVKTGAAYVPMDPAYPKERLEYMLADCEPALILSISDNQLNLQNLLNTKVPSEGIQNKAAILYVDQNTKNFSRQSIENPQRKQSVTAEDLAYLMYTSGSTGQPKGVCLNHRSIIRLVVNTWYLTIGSNDKIGHICNVCFDASAYEIWGALLNGATLIGFDRETVLSEDLFAEKLDVEGVTNMLMPTSLFHLYSRHRPEIFNKMRCLLIGGEPLHPEAARRVLKHSRPLHLINVYGPTENGVLTTVFDTWNLSEYAKNTPVGSPISNTTVYIVDKRNKEVPVGVVGELVSGGDGVGLGYWKLPEMTQKSFVPNPFSSDKNARMYRTGDLARRLVDGSFEVLGRRDDQVKVRGFRIEPGEIVAQINALENIKDAVVISIEGEHHKKYLAAYYVLAKAGAQDASSLRKALSDSLPAHMVPSFFIEISSIPITPNGKLDKAKLPKPHLEEVFRDNYVKPRNQTESDLVNIWTDVLGIKSVGVFDNFFELGGDSIISIQIVSRAKRAGINITPKLLFEHPNVAELALHVRKKENRVNAEQGLVSGEVRLTPIQQWFFEAKLHDVHYFNQSLLFHVNDFLTIQAITPVASALLKQHDVFRLRFNYLKGEWVQKHDNSARTLSSLADIVSEKNLAKEKDPYATMLDISKTIQNQLSLSEGPLLKIVLFHLGKQGQRLLIIAHHLLMDGLSWRILLDDLNLAFTQQSKNQPIDLGSKTTSYQFWSKLLKEYADSGAIAKAQSFWVHTLEKTRQLDIAPLFIKSSSKKGLEKVVQHRRTFSLTKEQSVYLLTECNQAYRTETQDLLLTAFCLSLKESGISDIAWFDMEGHGRDLLPGHFAEQVDNSQTLGWFTAVYPVLIDLSAHLAVHLSSEPQQSAQDIAALIKLIKSSLRAIPDHGSSFSVLKYLANDKTIHNLSASIQKPEISFNYLGQISRQDSGQGKEQVLSLDSHYLGADNSEYNQAFYPFNFSAVHEQEQFNFSVLYDNQRVDQTQVESFCTNFQRNIENIIKHCLKPENFGFTPSDLPYLAIEQATLDHICENNLVNISDTLTAIYPLSPMQEGMLFHSRLDRESGIYCEQVSVLFAGNLDLEKMNAAWNHAVAAHDILRTSFVWEDMESPLQIVHKKAAIRITHLDWRLEENIDQKLKIFLQNDRRHGFDFHQAPLMRLHYIDWPASSGVTNNQQLGRIIWSYHHILLDGWSMPILMREVFERYNYLANAEREQAARQALTYNPGAQGGSYENYIAWLYNNRSQEAQVFWKEYLQGFIEPSTLGINRQNDAQLVQNNALVQELRYQEQGVVLDQHETEALQNFAAKHHVTLNTILQMAWALLLNKYSGEEDIVFGITVSGRPSELSNVEAIIGLFINTVPFRVRINGKQALDDCLKQILKAQVQLRQFESTPLVEIQSQSEIDSSRALFDSILVFENYPLDETLSKAPLGLEVKDLKVYEQTNFPLSLIILPGKQLDIRLLFDSHTFSEANILQVLGHLKNILLNITQVEDSFEYPLAAIEYLSEAEKNTLLKEWNDTTRDYPRDLYLQEIISQVAKPDDLALISKTGSLSYQQLDSYSNQLANYLASDVLGEHKVSPGDRVVICLNRSAELIVAILAILKAGGVYVPLDPGYPEERQRYMLEDTQCRLVITDSENAALVKHLTENKAFRDSVAFVDISQLEMALQQEQKQLKVSLPAYAQNENTPAAILYTSGSTGQPKGVCLTHRGLSRMVINTNYMQIQKQDRVAHVSNICFDAASFEIWCALLNGLPLVILDRDVMLDLANFEKQLKENQVSIMLITTALFNLVAKERVQVFNNLRYVFFGGEASNAGMVKKVLEEGHVEHLMHMYGPSENATYASWYEVKQVSKDAKSIPIGKPVSNSQIYIMNQQGEFLPPGVAGEIVCAGDGLALGYLNKAEQTARAFVYRKVFGKEQRMYRTGDLGVFLADGNIQILGRIDNQVKIRGHRIEPEEIIARINRLEEIKKSYVLVKTDDEQKKFLVAYYVPEAAWLESVNDKNMRARALKAKLKTLMPDYMVPAFYVEIDELPLTPNGKIDTKALPEADILQSHSRYRAPENDLEKALVALWQEVLGRDNIGVHDDFFELGGHSLLVTQVHSRMRQQLNIDIPLRSLFELPTIREFSEFWQAVSTSKNLFSGDKSKGGEDQEEDFEEGEL